MRTWSRSIGFARCLRRPLLCLAAVSVAACTGLPTMTPRLITLGLQDGARWIEADDLDRYQCEEGPLVCTAASGRLTARLCRCVDPLSAAGSADPASQNGGSR